VSLPRERILERVVRRLVDDAFWLCAQIHRNAARQLAWLGRAGAWALAPFPWSCRLGAMAIALSVLSFWLGYQGEAWLVRAADFGAKELRILAERGLAQPFAHLALLARAAALLLALAALAAFVRHRLVPWLLKAGGAFFAALWAWLLFFLVRAPSALFLADAKTYDKSIRNDLWVAGVWAWVPGAALAALFLVVLSRRPIAQFYRAREVSRDRFGDRLLHTLKSPRDPRWRSSSYWAVFIHLFVLFLLPLLLRDWGMQKAYGVPKGSGNPVVQLVKVKRIEKKEKPKKKKFVLNMDSPILFYRPDIDESEIIKKVEEETRDTYVATALTDGKLGKGGGRSGGWPSGMENAKVRFIRLEYHGGDWDQDMGVNADYNLLLQFHKMTGFKIADATEHITIPQLRRFPKHRGPPFVFLTGSGGISASKKDVDTLRWYCLEEGGLIFADNGGGSFNHYFRALMRRCFPELEWVDIANDDILYQQPFVFPNGAPPLWHHSGMRALGLKHGGRWIVFYHQGDVNDAWKTGHSGATEAQAMQAYRLGVNIINYAFNQYMRIHYGD